MDEDGLQEALTQYKEQLNQIESVLESSGSHDELVQLKEDLEELIKTTEESLLCLKKSKLLQLVDNDDQSDSETQSQEDEAFDEEDSAAAGKTDAGKPMVMSDHFLYNGIKEIEDAIVGTQCQAPYSFEWGVKGYYNAMVLNVEKLNENCGELKVRVLFTNPTHRSMVPCPYFLDGKCRFDDDQCRYSHGCVVNISDLQEYTEPDFSVLKVDDKCLAKYDDGVWYKATILSITSDSINVHYDTYSIETCVPLEDVLPINDTEELSSDSDNENELNQEDDEEDVEAHVIAEFCPSHVDMHGALGNWEKHTRGIASKLMAKMGYVVGKGLGKNEDGRVEPVEIILLPTGKSLDACAELREKKKLKEPFKSKKKKKSSTQAPVQDVFEFINNKLGGRKGTLEDLKQNVQSKTLDRRKSGKHKSDTNYNIELFKLEQQKARIQKQIDKQKDSVSRNSTRDSTIAGQAMSKVVELQQKVKQLEDQEKWLKQRIHQNNEHKKLTVF